MHFFADNIHNESPKNEVAGYPPATEPAKPLYLFKNPLDRGRIVVTLVNNHGGFMFHFNAVIGILAFSTIVAGGLVWVALRQQETRGREPFCWMMASVALWLATSTLELSSNSLLFKILISKFQYLGVSSVALFWLLFVLRYTHHDRYLTRLGIGLLWVIPAITMMLAATNDLHGWVWPSVAEVPVPGGVAARFEHGPAVVLISVYSYILLAIGTLVLAKIAFRFPAIYRRQAVTMVVAAVLPWTGNLIYLMGLSPVPWLDLTPLMFAAAGVLVALTVFRFRLLEALPIAHDVVFWGMSDGVAVMDSSGRLLDVNPAARQLLGVGDQSVGALGQDVFAAWPELKSLCRSPVSAECECRINGPDGLRWFHARYLTVTMDGKSAGRLLTLRDVTAQRQAEEEKRALESQFQQTQRLESLGIMAGGVAHDFNNLLMVISGNLEFLRSGLVPGHHALKDLAEAERALQRASQLTHQLLAYSGKSQLAAEAVDVNQLLREMVPMLELSAAKKVALTFRLAAHVRPVRADLSQIRQVIMNLVLNGVEAMGQNTGEVAVSTGCGFCDGSLFANMWLHEELPDGDYVWLDISDTGEGIPPEMLSHIFDPFFTTKFVGRGLGLAAVLGIVRGHKGAIQVESSPGKGTTFRIYLPALDVTDELNGHDGGGSLVTHGRGFGRILLVDDEPVLRSVGWRMLETMGYEVVEAEDGLAGVEVFKEHQDSLRCVVMDLTMPRMNGDQALARIWEIKPDMPALIVSGYPPPQLVFKNRHHAKLGFLPKPFTRDQLSGKLKEILR